MRTSRKEVHSIRRRVARIEGLWKDGHGNWKVGTPIATVDICDVLKGKLSRMQDFDNRNTEYRTKMAGKRYCDKLDQMVVNPLTGKEIRARHLPPKFRKRYTRGLPLFVSKDWREVAAEKGVREGRVHKTDQGSFITDIEGI